jgi:hypothetical protein
LAKSQFFPVDSIQTSLQAKWIADIFKHDLVAGSFIPPLDIRQLRDLMRYRTKLTNFNTSEKSRAQNCLTVSNIQLANANRFLFAGTLIVLRGKTSPGAKIFSRFRYFWFSREVYPSNRYCFVCPGYKESYFCYRNFPLITLCKISSRNPIFFKGLGQNSQHYKGKHHNKSQYEVAYTYNRIEIIVSKKIG